VARGRARPIVGTALAPVHRKIGFPWTIAGLAAEVDVVGIPFAYC
jgi:hypothetical protein